MPTDDGRHGIQLWANLPADKKMMEPSYKDYPGDEIAEFHKKEAVIRVIAGIVDDYKGPVKTETTNLLAHVYLPAQQSVTLEVTQETAEELGLYVTKGELAMDDGDTLAPGRIAILADGNSVTLKAGDKDADCMLLGGDAVKDNIIFDGPFVMDTEERIIQAYRDYRSGKMGSLTL